MYKKLAILGLLASSAFASAAVVTLNLSLTDVDSTDLLGDPDNSVGIFDMGVLAPGLSNFEVVGIGWDVTLFADSPSWLSEMGANFGSSTTGFVNLFPGIGDDISGTKAYSSGGVVDLVGLNLDFALNADNKFRLEFFEDFDDYTNDWDGKWNGTLTVKMNAVPEPGTFLAVGAGLALIARRRRKS